MTKQSIHAGPDETLYVSLGAIQILLKCMGSQALAKADAGAPDETRCLSSQTCKALHERLSEHLSDLERRSCTGPIAGTANAEHMLPEASG